MLYDLRNTTTELPPVTLGDVAGSYLLLFNCCICCNPYYSTPSGAGSISYLILMILSHN